MRCCVTLRELVAVLPYQQKFFAIAEERKASRSLAILIVAAASSAVSIRKYRRAEVGWTGLHPRSSKAFCRSAVSFSPEFVFYSHLVARLVAHVFPDAGGPAAVTSFRHGVWRRRWCSTCRRESSWGGSVTDPAWR